MGFDLYSFDSPGEHQKEVAKAWFRATQEISPFDRQLHTRTNISCWSEIVRIIEQNVDSSILDATAEYRVFRPNTEDYALFVGETFRPKGMPPSPQNKKGGEFDQVFKMMGFDDITPNYSRCAACTKPDAPSHCGKCKVVKYCGRECQLKHWKEMGHKKRCCKAQPNSTLRSVLRGGNDYLHITAAECAALAEGLKRHKPDNESVGSLVTDFALYFTAVSKLGGCFVG